MWFDCWTVPSSKGLCFNWTLCCLSKKGFPRRTVLCSSHCAFTEGAQCWAGNQLLMCWAVETHCRRSSLSCWKTIRSLSTFNFPLIFTSFFMHQYSLQLFFFPFLLRYGFSCDMMCLAQAMRFLVVWYSLVCYGFWMLTKLLFLFMYQRKIS